MSWKPMDLNDFEKQMVDLEPDKNFIFSRERDYDDKKRRHIMDRRSTKEDRELNLLSHLHETNVIPKYPGKLLDRKDLENSDPSVEAVRMMRSIGMQPSINERMVASRSIAAKKKQPRIIYDRNRPILLGEEFFKFRLQPKKEPEPPIEEPEPPIEEPVPPKISNDSLYFDCSSSNSSYYSCSGQ